MFPCFYRQGLPESLVPSIILAIYLCFDYRLWAANLLIKLVINLPFLFWHIFTVSHCGTSSASLFFPYSSHSCCISGLLSLSFYHSTYFSVFYGHPIFQSFGEGFSSGCLYMYVYIYIDICGEGCVYSSDPLSHTQAHVHGCVCIKCTGRTGLKISPCKTSLEAELAENRLLSTNLLKVSVIWFCNSSLLFDICCCQ